MAERLTLRLLEEEIESLQEIVYSLDRRLRTIEEPERLARMVLKGPTTSQLEARLNMLTETTIAQLQRDRAALRQDIIDMRKGIATAQMLANKAAMPWWLKLVERVTRWF